MKKNLLLLALFMGISSGLVRSAVYMDTTIVASNGKHKLTISVPDDYTSSNSYSLVLALQPCNGTSYKTYLQALAPITDSLHFIVACPDNSGNSVADGNIDIIKASIDSVMAMYNIDNEQVYLTGMSCNGEVALRQGLKKVYPFKGIFPYAPYNPSLKDFSSDMPVTIAVGTKDEYSYNQILNTYDSLHTHGAKVNLVLIPNITHTYAFAEFGNEMIHALNYLRLGSTISLNKPGNFMEQYAIYDTDAEFTIDFTTNNNKTLSVSALSSNTAVIDNPQVDYTAAEGKIAVKIKPKAGKIGKAIIVLEAMDKTTDEISQVTFKVAVTKNKTAVSSIESKVFEMYPNPASEKLFFKTDANFLHIQVVDLQGRIVLTSKVDKDSYLNISSLKSGQYFIKGIADGKEENVILLVK